MARGECCNLLCNMGNGARYVVRDLTSAQQKRERNAKGTGKEAKSQLKANEAAKNIVCQICRQSFLMTVREPAYVLSS